MVNAKKEVTVVGAGLAGLTAALKLAERGYPVTIYENQHVLGGNVGSFPKDPGDPDSPWYDVYPHMFAAFYKNFWSLVEDDLGLTRTDLFEPRNSVKVLGQDGKYTAMTDIESLRSVWKNLFDGPQPPADMIVSMYALLDLLCEPVHRKELLSAYSVAGFLGSKPYMTERAAELHDYLLIVVWSTHSFGISAASYKSFFSFGLPQSSPMNWVLRKDSYHALIVPILERFEELENVTIKTNGQVAEIVADDDGRIYEMVVKETAPDPISGATLLVEDGAVETVQIDGPVILAVGPKAMAEMAQHGDASVSEARGLTNYFNQMGRNDKVSGRSGRRRLVEFMPELSESRQARAEPIAVANIYFDKRLADIPTGHVSLGGSAMNLSFLDISQLWDSLKGPDNPTVLTLAASNYYGLPSASNTDLGRYRDLVAMVKELQKYLPQVELARIDWKKSHFHTNLTDELFVNDVASEGWRPTTHDERLPNLFLAGGYCLNEVGMATVEGAVMTGLHAAEAIHDGSGTADPVVELEHEAYPDSVVHAMKLALMPLAYQAKWWSTMSDVAKDAGNLENPLDWGQELASLWTLPGACAMDWWSTTVGLCTALKNDVLGRR